MKYFYTALSAFAIYHFAMRPDFIIGNIPFLWIFGHGMMTGGLIGAAIIFFIEDL